MADPTSAAVETLEWDSEFFGVPIGRIELEGASDEAISAGEAEARARGLRCLYASLDPEHTVRSFQVQQLGYRFVEAATLFELDPREPPIPRPDGVEVRLGTEADLDGIQTMVDLLANWSRFAVDPRFGGEEARRMQTAWVRRAATAPEGDFSLVIAEDDTGPIAFISRARDPQPVVDTVGTTTRGSGAARYLIEDARAWASPGPLLGGPIAARNVAALRYVSHCGYRVNRVRYLYHRWLDED